MVSLRRLALVLSLSSLLLLSGCSVLKDAFNSLTQQSGSSEETASSDPEDLSAVDSLNLYVDLANAAQEQIDDYLTYDMDSIERNTLIGKGKAYIELLDNIKGQCKELAKYVNAEDFKDDAFARSTELLDAIWANIDEFYVLHDDLIEYIDVLFDKYEDKSFDPNDPIDVALHNMDGVLEKTDGVLDLLEDPQAISDPNALQLAYEELDGMLAVHAGNEKPALLDAGLQSAYDGFYSSLETQFLPGLKKMVRQYNSQEWDALDESASYAISDYNILVDYYNAVIDAS
jgi:hypothetical protein